MSISAPEAHSSHTPDKILRGAEEYAGGPADFGDIPADEHTIDDTRLRAGDRFREERDGERTRGRHLARAALIASMAGELMQRAHSPDATPDSRRLAIELASAALGRRYSAVNRQQNITRRYM